MALALNSDLEKSLSLSGSRLPPLSNGLGRALRSLWENEGEQASASVDQALIPQRGAAVVTTQSPGAMGAALFPEKPAAVRGQGHGFLVWDHGPMTQALLGGLAAAPADQEINPGPGGWLLAPPDSCTFLR